MTISFRDLTAKFLAWSAIHQEPRTTEYYKGYAEKFIEHLGDAAELPAEQMKSFQVNEWTDHHAADWGDNYRRGAVVAINRIFNWGMNEDRIAANPIKKAFKPASQRRNTYMKPEDYRIILSHVAPADPFHDLLIFVWTTGVRPQEVRHIEHRHVSLEKGYILFPKEESKGKRRPRKILLNDTAKEIIVRLMAKNPDGKVFCNTRNAAWTKFAVCARMDKLSKMTGIKMTLYAARHGFGTRKLKANHGHLEIAACMGHVDGSMLAKIYSHIDEDDEHLRAVLDD